MIVVSRRLAPFSHFDLMLLRQIALECLIARRCVSRLLDLCPDVVLPRGLALLEKGFLRQCIAYGRLSLEDDRQSLLETKPIALLPDPVKVFLRGLVLAAVLEVHGIDDDVVMDMLLVRMRVDDGFMPFGDGSSEFLPDLVRLSCRHFPRLEGLDDVMGLDAVRFAPEFSCRLHLRLGVLWRAIDA